MNILSKGNITIFFYIFKYGTCTIRNLTTGEHASINFKPAGWFSKEMNQVEGYIYNEKYVSFPNVLNICFFFFFFFFFLNNF